MAVRAIRKLARMLHWVVCVLLGVLAGLALVLPPARPTGIAYGRLTLLLTPATLTFGRSLEPTGFTSFVPQEIYRSFKPSILEYGDPAAFRALFVSIGRDGRMWIKVDRALCFALLALYPSVSAGVFLYRRGKRAGRADAGRCLACGYDLTGNTTGRCPECGQATDLPLRPARRDQRVT